MLLTATSAGYAAVAVVSTAVGAVGCLGKQKAGQCGFGLMLACTTLPPWLLAMGLQLLGGLGPLGPSKELAAKAEITFTALMWRLGLGFCWWVRVSCEGLDTYRRELGETGRPVCVLVNHTSFLDTILSVATAPLNKVGRYKMMVAQHLLEMPVIGRIATVMGHLCIPFKTGGPDGGMEVDKEKTAVVMKDYEEYLASGGICAWFPEGTINPGDCSKVARFRAGGFGIAVRNDVEIWCQVFVGNAKCWGKYVAVGGYPAHIGMKCFCLCKSSRELLASSEASGADERGKSLFLANLAQKEMQNAIDAFVAKGIDAGDNTKKRKGNKEVKDDAAKE